MNKIKILGISILALLIALSICVNAQPGNPPTPDDPVPLTGLEFLIAAGGALGGYKLFKKFRGNDNAH